MKLIDFLYEVFSSYKKMSPLERHLSSENDVYSEVSSNPEDVHMERDYTISISEESKKKMIPVEVKPYPFGEE